MVMPYNPLRSEVLENINKLADKFMLSYNLESKPKLPIFLQDKIKLAFVSGAKEFYQYGWWKGYSDRADEIKLRLGLSHQSDTDSGLVDY